MDSEEPITFDTKVLNNIFKTVWKKQKTKVRKDALLLSAEYLRLFTDEAISRAAIVAKKDNLGETLPRLEVHHLEKIAPQLRRDF
ncbi:centromere protein X-like protein [Gigaspora margarita]|uniref:Centromere protein X-like protein n=1 Tax=Gigaspora margarita TaxID=4874 RepID=A0A8H4AMH7_GIGMA|nr:centromere protein X-like protein [Gigaspora margarita]